MNQQLPLANEGKMTNKICQECGLAFDICNSLAMYRQAVKYFKLGRNEDAERFAESAEEYYDAYRGHPPKAAR